MAHVCASPAEIFVHVGAAASAEPAAAIDMAVAMMVPR